MSIHFISLLCLSVNKKQNKRWYQDTGKYIFCKRKGTKGWREGREEEGKGCSYVWPRDQFQRNGSCADGKGFGFSADSPASWCWCFRTLSFWCQTLQMAPPYQGKWILSLESCGWRPSWSALWHLRREIPPLSEALTFQDLFTCKHQIPIPSGLLSNCRSWSGLRAP